MEVYTYEKDMQNSIICARGVGGGGGGRSSHSNKFLQYRSHIFISYVCVSIQRPRYFTANNIQYNMLPNSLVYVAARQTVSTPVASYPELQRRKLVNKPSTENKWRLRDVTLWGFSLVITLISRSRWERIQKAFMSGARNRL